MFVHPKYLHQWIDVKKTPMDTCLKCGKHFGSGHKCVDEGLSKSEERLIVCVLNLGFEAKKIRYLWE